ncbi:protein containing RagB/SusD domain protein, partial [human gut metagenome]
NVTFPSFRLGEIYLNYIEAVFECERNGISDPDVSRDLAMQYWDELRDRSGMASILEAYPSATPDEMVELVRRERRVELAFEGLRFYDTRTWMIATQTDNGPMYGMDTSVPGSGTTTPDGFWRRVSFENRIFRNNHYLFPFPQRELDRNKLLTQNYGW